MDSSKLNCLSLLSLVLFLIFHTVSAADEALDQHYTNLDIPVQQDDYIIHDPSRIVTKRGYQMIAVTGKAQEDGYQCGLETWYRPIDTQRWQPGQCLFKDKPSWVIDIIEEQDGAYWAPELVKPRVMVYSVADYTDQSSYTCVGLARATGTFPNKMTWKDSGKPLSCVNKEDFDEEVSAIDPSILTADDGTTYLITGGGIIHGTELNELYRPVSGNWFSPDAEGWTMLARGPETEDGYGWIEAPYAYYHNGWYYLFVNWGACCSRADSTYNVRVGRSRDPLGPYLDKEGVDLLYGGGSLFLESERYMIGPGHVGIRKDSEQFIVSFHYYDARRGGASWIAERRMFWSGSGWPRLGKVLSRW